MAGMCAHVHNQSGAEHGAAYEGQSGSKDRGDTEVWNVFPVDPTYLT